MTAVPSPHQAFLLIIPSKWRLARCTLKLRFTPGLTSGARPTPRPRRLAAKPGARGGLPRRPPGVGGDGNYSGLSLAP